MKLLNYTSYRYFLFAALLTVLSIPVSYMLLNRIFVASVDKDLKLQGDLIPAELEAIRSQRDLELWRALDHDLNIIPADSMTFSAAPFTMRKKHKSQEVSEDFRILQKEVMILGKKYYVNIESSLVENEALIQTLLWIQLGIFFVLLSGAALINYHINKKVWQPFYDSLAYLKGFRMEDPVPGYSKKLRIEEFEQLHQSIAQLSVRVQKSYALHKEFLENVSHELQTPLTFLKFKLELLLQHQQLTEAQSQVIGDMYSEIEHMQELNSNFLLLSKMDNDQFSITEHVDMREIVEELHQELSFLLDAKGQVINISNEGNSILQGNRVLLKILVKNLWVNAIRYSVAGGQISLSLNRQQMVICNPGSPIPIPEDKLFERVIKHRYHEGAKTGNGLGLSIVKRIAVYHKATVAYVYIPGVHQFTFRWA